MCTVKTPWERVVEFHGHVCPGLAIGFRAAEIALRELMITSLKDESLVAIVETDACSADAIQVLTGCTFGKGNLIFLDHGKQGFSLVRRQSEDGVRVVLNYGAINQDPDQIKMLQKMAKGQMGQVELEEFYLLQRQKTEHLMQVPEKELFTVYRVHIQLPSKARIFPTVECNECGEGVMELRARLQEGRVVCSACCQAYQAPITAGLGTGQKISIVRK